MRAASILFLAVLWAGVAHGQLERVSFTSRCASYLSRQVAWLTARPNRVVAIVKSGPLVFTFGQGTVPDKIEIVAKGRKYLLYSGQITRIPVRVRGYIRGPGKVPAAIAHRVSSYFDDHSSQWERMQVVGTAEGALILSFVPGYSQVELGIGMHKWPGVFTIFRLPTQLKYLAKASIQSIGSRIPPEDPEVTWDVTMYGDEYVLVTLAESDTSKNYFRGGDELWAALSNVVERPDGTRVFDYPMDNQETWIIKSSGLFEDKTPEQFPFSIHEYGHLSMRLATHALGSQAKIKIFGGKLTVGASGPQSIDSEYFVLGDVEHESESWDLGQLEEGPPSPGVVP